MNLNVIIIEHLTQKNRTIKNNVKVHKFGVEEITSKRDAYNIDKYLPIKTSYRIVFKGFTFSKKISSYL